jgi:hypothetical protein
MPHTICKTCHHHCMLLTTCLAVVCWLQTLNEDYFAIFDLQQASLPGVRALLVLRRAIVQLDHDCHVCASMPENTVPLCRSST